MKLQSQARDSEVQVQNSLQRQGIPIILDMRSCFSTLFVHEAVE